MHALLAGLSPTLASVVGGPCHDRCAGVVDPVEGAFRYASVTLPHWHSGLRSAAARLALRAANPQDADEIQFDTRPHTRPQSAGDARVMRRTGE